MLLKDKVVIITGAGNELGIGFAAAKLFISHGAKVALMDLNQAAVTSAANILGANAIGIQADVRSEDSCKDAVEQVQKKWGALDVLLNNAGVVGAQRVTQITRKDYDAVLDVNLRGTLHMSQACIPYLPREGAIICMASIAAQRGGGLLGGAHYAASKGGILGLMRAMARELGPLGIRVNAINPGLILTSLNLHIFDDATCEQFKSQIPIGRLGGPEDVAGACLFLASPLSTYITGASIDVNGGMHIH
jgi:NAD(P)-dependent dehydrogenase (short-subunit alcohol dehydrogenase family)